MNNLEQLEAKLLNTTNKEFFRMESTSMDYKKIKILFADNTEMAFESATVNVLTLLNFIVGRLKCELYKFNTYYGDSKYDTEIYLFRR